MSTKLKRIESAIAREIGIIIQEEARDEMIKNVSITEVSVDNDLTFAKVYFMTRESDTKKVEKNLNEAAGFIRKNLAKSLNLRSTPELRFVYDTTIDYGMKIEKILKDINEGE